MRSATIKPQVPASLFPPPKVTEPEVQQQPNTSRRRTETTRPARKPSTTSDDFGDDGIDDEALVTASFGDLDFDHIDNYPDPTAAITRKNTAKNKSVGKQAKIDTKASTNADHHQEPAQLPNGKWACCHKCKDKTACKHLCCKEGMDKPPKKIADAKGKSEDTDQCQDSQISATQPRREVQTKLQITASKRKSSANVEELDFTQQEKKQKLVPVDQRTKEYREPHQLHKSIQGQNDLPRSIYTVMSTKPAYCYSQGGEHKLSFMAQGDQDIQVAFSDYGDVQFDEVSSHFDHPVASFEERIPESVTQNLEDDLDNDVPIPHATNDSEIFGDDDSVLGAAMVGIADSQWLGKNEMRDEERPGNSPEDFDFDFEADVVNDGCSMDIDHDLSILDQVRVPNRSRHQIMPQSQQQSKKKHGSFILNDSSTGPNNHVSSAAVEAGKSTENSQLKQPRVKAGLPAESEGEFDPEDEENMQQVLDMLDDEPAVPGRVMPDAFRGLDPWVFQEYGDVVELVDD